MHMHDTLFKDCIGKWFCKPSIISFQFHSNALLCISLSHKILKFVVIKWQNVQKDTEWECIGMMCFFRWLNANVSLQRFVTDPFPSSST